MKTQEDYIMYLYNSADELEIRSSEYRLEAEAREKLGKLVEGDDFDLFTYNAEDATMVIPENLRQLLRQTFKRYLKTMTAL